MKFPTFHLSRPSLRKGVRSIRQNRYRRQLTDFINNRPFSSFFVALGILLGLIILGNVLNSLSKKDETQKVIVKDVAVYKIGETAKVTYQGLVENSGVITIMAQAPGIVQTVHVTEGDTVAQGQTVVSLSSNYQGGNAPALQSQLASAQLQNVLDTYDKQKELINKQREVADQTGANAEELRKIQESSVSDINGAQDTSEAILRSLQASLQTLEITNSSGSNDALILQTQQGIAQIQGGLAQLNAQQRTAELQGGSDKPPAKLAELQKDITKKQLDIQEKGLELSKKSARIQASLAAVNAAVMFPASPAQGTVEKIHVQEGESVQPGTVIATVKGVNDDILINVLVPSSVAPLISRSEPSVIHIGTAEIKAVPYYVSGSPTQGQLYSALYSVTSAVPPSQGGYIAVTIPLNADVKIQNDPYVPIDSVYQTQESAYVYMVEGNTARTKEVTIGGVFGQYAQVIKGVSDGDEIILNRNVIAGEKVNVIRN